MRIILFGVALIIFSCTYEPTEENHVVLNQHPPVFAISLQDYDDVDTIKLYGNTTLHYDFSSDKGAFLGVMATAGNSQILNSNNPTGSIYIDAVNLGTGFHSLKISFQNTSGTGSLVDHAGGEGYEVWKSWVLDIDVAPPEDPHLQLSIKNGFLNLNWDKYKKPNFDHFLIRYSEYGIDRMVKITNPTNNNWVDSTFLIGRRDYTLSVSTNLRSTSSTKSYTAPVFTCTTIHNPSDSTLTANWNSPPLYGSFVKIDVYDGSLYRYTITDPNETTAKIKINKTGFLLPAYVYLRVYARNRSDEVDVMTSSVDQTIKGNQISPSYSSLTYNQGTNAIYARRFDNDKMMLVKLDHNLKGVDSLQLPTSTYVPFNGSAVNYNGANWTVVLFDLVTQQTSSVAIFKPNDNIIGPPGALSYSSVGNIACYTYITVHLTQGIPYTIYFMVYNTNTNTILHTESKKYLRLPTSPYYEFSSALSENGAFVVIDGKRYKVTATDLQDVSQQILPGYFYGFRPEDGNQFILSDNGKLVIYDGITNTIVKTVSLPGYAYVNYDAATKSVLFISPGSSNVNECKIVSLETGLVIKTIIVNDSKSYRLLNGFLISGSRFLKVL